MNLVLGAVRGLEIEYISPFLFSLAMSGFKGKVVFFVSRTSDRTRAMLDRMNVEIVSVDENSAFTATPVNSLRYFVYEQFLDSFPAEVTNIMLADVRDIVFQRDPFDFDMGGKLCCFLEDRKNTLSTSVINSGWLAAACGKEALKNLGHNYISCSGFTIGPAKAVRAYLSAMTQGLRTADERSPNIMHVVGGIDQAIHNYLLYTGELGEPKIFGNDDGPVLTLNYVTPESIDINEEDQVYNLAGNLVHVLHQYDRHPELARRLLGRIEKDSTSNQS